MNGPRYLSYRVLSAVLMVLCFLIGAQLLHSFFGNTIMPAAMAPAPPFVPTNYWGLYMMGFAGALLLTWGAMLVAAVRAPVLARAVGTATAFGLVINAIFRMAAWFSGEYAEAGNVPRVEATIMLLLALGFIWLRPSRNANAAARAALQGGRS